ncbi:hypothetical protein Bca52824_039307 [Brassica carinata]|uniref:Uncharacterized protein n=1 Tax=Brassica carinata TaxID=52824 RepID=A0A8X7RSS6_BRACI|nr:hypothetical protein Bca52824_039307 [Brassica carinata]
MYVCLAFVSSGSSRRSSLRRRCAKPVPLLYMGRGLNGLVKRRQQSLDFPSRTTVSPALDSSSCYRLLPLLQGFWAPFSPVARQLGAPVEGPPIPAIGDAARAESAEAHAHLVEAPGGEALEEPEEVRCLRMSLPDGGNASVVDIAKQFQSEHGNGNDEEDDCSKDGDMEISGLAEMSAMVEKFEMSHKAKNDVAKVGEKEKESGDVQTETKKNKRERKCDGKEGGPLKKAKGSDNMRSPIRTRGHKKEAAEKEAAENRTARAQKKAGEQKKACEKKKKANKGGKEKV